MNGNHLFRSSPTTGIPAVGAASRPRSAIRGHRDPGRLDTRRGGGRLRGESNAQPSGEVTMCPGWVRRQPSGISEHPRRMLALALMLVLPKTRDPPHPEHWCVND